MARLSTDEIEWIVYLVIVSIFIIPLLVLWIISLVSVHRKRDPARVGTIWVKIAFPLWIISLVLEMTQAAMYFSFRYGSAWSTYSSLVAFNLLNVSGLFEDLAQVAVLVAFVELGRGFLLGASPSPVWHTIFRGVMLGWSVVLFILAFADFGLSQDLNSAAFRSTYGYHNSGSAKWRSLYRLNESYSVLSWIPALVILGFAVFIVLRAQRSRLMKSSAVFLLIAAIFSFVRRTYQMIIYFVFLDPLRARGPLIYPQLLNLIVTPAISVIGMFIVLNMLYNAVKQRAEAGGLWSAPLQEQPMMYAAGGAGQAQTNNAPMPYVPIGSGSNGGAAGFYAPQPQQMQTQPQMTPSYGGGQAQYGAEAPYIAEEPSSQAYGYGYGQQAPYHGGQPVYENRY
ncbi:hypothetical protein B0T22DRAFT_470931 [Podospora appendiculata]|uniref:Uncharacterized protein n=1 Tax=Podospora appendiculata TaxID=314037 RepID=A0AAE1C840_9PEZI|nr:hypothetical protein B0T22DRAFT_470931 [Podospora appendiculata]